MSATGLIVARSKRSSMTKSEMGFNNKSTEKLNGRNTIMALSKSNESPRIASLENHQLNLSNDNTSSSQMPSKVDDYHENMYVALDDKKFKIPN